jgi:MFS family permease
VDSANARSGHVGWIHTLGALGAIVFPLAVLFGFFTSSDSGDTGPELIAYAEDNSTELWFLQIVALLAPLLIGVFVASLWTRLRLANEALRALTLVGGTLFVAFLSVGLTLWAAPLLSSDELTSAGAEAYLAYDDAGWVLLGLAGISIGTMIIGVSLAALDHGWVPKWAGWLSLALGVVSLATIVAVGFFAWMIWLFAAGLFLLLKGELALPAAEAPRAVA